MHSQCNKCQNINKIKEILNERFPIEIVNIIISYAIKKKTICEYFN